MKNPSVSIVKVLIIVLAIAALAGSTVSKGEVRGDRETSIPDGSRPEQNPPDRSPFAPLPPSGLTVVGVPAIVTESPGQMIISPQPAGGAASRAMAVPIPNDIVSPSDTHTSTVTLDPTPLSAATPPLSTNFLSTDFDDNITTTGGFVFIPPDPMAAAGYTHLINVVNVTIRVHLKDSTMISQESLASFFTPPSPPAGYLIPQTFTFDPKVIYDQFEDRFLIVTLERTTSPQTSRIYVAVSDPGDATMWTVSSIDSKTMIGGSDHWADFPGLAVDEEAVYITANMFSFSNAFGGVRVWILNKGLSGGFYDSMAATFTVHDPYASCAPGCQAETTQPAHIFGPASTNVGTFLVSYSGLTDVNDVGVLNEFVQVVRIDNPLGTPTFTQQFVDVGNIEENSQTLALPNAPQSGDNTDIETNDRDALNAVWRDDFLWMTATINPKSGDPDSGEATAHWFKLNTTNLGSITLADQGSIGGEDIPGGLNNHTFFPSIAVNFFNNAAIGFSASGPSIFPGSYYTLAGTTHGTETLREGLDSYVRTFTTGPARNRWGDYSGTAVDPENQCFWVYNEHAIEQGTVTRPPPEDGRWGTAYGFFCPPCSETFALTAGQWKQISLSCDVASNTVANVIGDDLTGTYGTDWGLFKWNGTSYDSMTTASPLDAGRGYWIKTLNTEQSVIVEGVLNQVIEFPLFPLTVDAADGEFTMVGFPFSTPVCAADVEVMFGASVLSLDEADPLVNGDRACEVGHSSCVMSREMCRWNGAAYECFDGETPGMEGTLEIGDGLWVKAFEAGLKLRIPLVPSPVAGCYTEMMAGPATSGPATGGPATDGPATGGVQTTGPSGTQSAQAGSLPEPWFVRLIAESGNLRDAGNVLGQLPESVNRYDRHDLIELAPFDSPYLTVVFPHSNWGRQAGDYTSDFHALQERLNDRWSFEVMASDPGQEVTLRWEGEASLLEEMVLIDRETGERVLVQPDGSYTFTMNGTRHAFRWLAGGSRPRGRP